MIDLSKNDKNLVELLQEQNSILHEQIKQLVKTEKRLYRTQNELDEQILRINALTGFHLEATLKYNPQTVLDLALDLLCNVFSLDDGIGLLVDDKGQLLLKARKGYDIESVELLSQINWTMRPEWIYDLNEPVILTALEHGRSVATNCLDSLEEDVHKKAQNHVLYLKGGINVIIPLRRLTALLVMRKIDRTLFPLGKRSLGKKDTPFLRVVKAHLDAALENAFLHEEVSHFATSLEVKLEQLLESEAQLQAQHMELEDAYEKLKELDLLKEKFISVSAHELRTPLTVIRGYISLLASRRINFAKDGEKAISAIQENTERLVSIVAQVTDTAKLREKRLYLNQEHVCLPEIINMVMNEMQTFIEVRKQTLESKIENPLLFVYADRQRIQQVLANLLLNAIRFTHDGGNIFITASKASGNKGFVQVSIADSGVGIEEDQLERIFDEFYEVSQSRYHHSGTIEFQSAGIGLGLSVAKGIIEEHGGKIWAESRRSRGSTGSVFHVLLPEQKQVQN